MQGVRLNFFFEHDFTTGRHFVNLSSYFHIYGYMRGVENAFAVQRIDEVVVCLNVVVDFAVGCKPNIFFMLGKFGTGIFDNIPVVIVVELVTVAPDIEEPRFAVFEVVRGITL